MNILVKLASGFMNLFTLGGEQFVSWVTGIIPTVLMLLLLMNAIIALAGDESVNKLARVCTKNPILRYLVLPFVSAFMLGNPMALSMGKFMPEFYKPAYYASATYHCHTNNGIFPHINASELFVWLGIANGISTLKYNTFSSTLSFSWYCSKLYFRMGNRVYNKICRKTAGCKT